MNGATGGTRGGWRRRLALAALVTLAALSLAGLRVGDADTRASAAPPQQEGKLIAVVGQDNMAPPSWLTGVTAVSAGYYHNLALMQNGAVAGWGNNGDGQTAVPSGLTGVTAIAAGGYHSLALKSDGTVGAWGENIYNQAQVPTGLNGVVAIAAGFFHSLALKSDGTVVGWGYNDHGEAVAPYSLSDVIAIAAGSYHSIALRRDGTVIGWGSNYQGQTNVPPGLSGVVAIAARGYHNLALKDDGTVIGWGDDFTGAATPPDDLTGVSAISTGFQNSLALKRDGTVVGWGYDGAGHAARLNRLTGITAIAAGWSYSLALVPPQPQAIDFPPLADRPYGSQPFALNATGGDSGKYVTYTTSTPEVCTLSGVVGSTVTIVGAGRCTIAADQAAGGVYTAAPQRQQSFTVSQATLTVRADDQRRPYGSADPTLTATITGFVNGETLATSGVTGTPTLQTTATPLSSTLGGPYPIVPDVGTLAARNYRFTFVQGRLFVSPAWLRATAEDRSRAYGAPDPAFGVAYDGFVNGETSAVLGGGLTCTTTTTARSGVGTYRDAIRCGGQTTSNYDLTYRPGTLTITPAPLMIAADDKTRAYGAANPPLTATYSGLVNGDTPVALDGTLACATTADRSSPPSPPTYPITCGGQRATNYAITYRPGALTIAEGVALALEVLGPGAVTVTPAGVPNGAGRSRHIPGATVTLTPQPQAGMLFLGWTVDGAMRGTARPLTLTMGSDHVVVATFAAPPSFADVPPNGPSTEAITQLAARGIIRGYADGRFGPDDRVLRAQVAAMIARATPSGATDGPCVGKTWDCEDWRNPYTDRGTLGDDLWRNVGTLSHYNVAYGYGDGRFGPNDPVSYAQTISFVARAMVAKGYWQQQPADPAVFGGALRGTGHERDVATYFHYVGPPPGTDPAVPWVGWERPAPRAWVAQALWRAFDAYWSADRVP